MVTLFVSSVLGWRLPRQHFITGILKAVTFTFSAMGKP